MGGGDAALGGFGAPVGGGRSPLRRGGAVEDLAHNRVNLDKAITHWPDMLKVAGSRVTNQVRAYDLLRMFGREGRPTSEYGRIAKTELPEWSTRWTTPTGVR